MIKLEKTTIYGWAEAIRGMRNPMNSWDKSDSLFFDDSEGHTCTITQGCNELSLIELGENDLDLTTRLAHNGPVHAKYRRMITVYVDITAPLYWWKEFDTYKVGTVCNSCSTMHKIHAKEFTLDDFSHEKLLDDIVSAKNPKGIDEHSKVATRPMAILRGIVDCLNTCRLAYLEHRGCDGIYAKELWHQMIQLLPSSYNQKRTIQMNYEVLANIYESRRNHKLDEWRHFCDWIEELPYSEIITGEK